MRALLLSLILLSLPCLSFGKRDTLRLHTFDVRALRDSASPSRQSIELNTGWLYMGADSAQMAMPEYNDAHWPLTYSGMFIIHDTVDRGLLEGPVWFRYHFRIDTSLVNTPLALLLDHHGASEVYLDGKKIGGFGIVNRQKPEYEVPYLPIVFQVADTAPHLLAIRYINLNARVNHTKFDQSDPGFMARLGIANKALSRYGKQNSVIYLICTFLWVLFLVMALSHLLLYAFNRAERSNLFFSLFCLGFSVSFAYPIFPFISPSPFAVFCALYIIPPSAALTLLGLSGMVNHLFAKKLLRFKVTAALAPLPVVLCYFDLSLGIYSFFVLIIVVTLEAIVLIIAAMRRKVKGVRIVGIGLLLFSLFFLGVASWLSVNENITFDNTTSGTLLAIALLIALLSIPVSFSIYLAWRYADLNKGLKQKIAEVEQLSEKALAQEQEKKNLLAAQNELLERQVAERTAQVVAQRDEIQVQHTELVKEKHRSDNLLLNILPAEVAEELKEHGSSVARSFDNVTVLFTDFVDFTTTSERLTPQELVGELNSCFTLFDKIMHEHGIEKIKTVGDAYLAVCGLPVPDEQHAIKVITAAKAIQTAMRERKEQLGERTFEIRLGVNSGSLVAGIVGIKKFAYDIWGDTVNTAARMEQNSEPGKINISESTYQLVSHLYSCHYRGAVEVKGKGIMKMYFVE